LIAAVVLLLSLPAVGSAQEEQPPEGAMLIILDASGSMNNVDEAGVPYIDKAKAAILELIDALPDGMQVGLRVYGHREPNTDPVQGCLDTELLAPVKPLDRTAIREAIEGVEASGFTPIGLSLQEAAADLPESGPRSIVLISDGEDTCAPPDPCRVAEELFGDLLDVRIESVGFLIDTGSAAEQQLRCIADVTGGQYRSVDVAGELVARLGEVADTLADWRPPATLHGALDQAAAPAIPLTPKADWVTDEPGKIAVQRFTGIIMPGEIRWYQLDLWEWETAWVWADLEWPPDLEAGGHLEAIILDANGTRVEADVGHGGIPLRAELPGTDSPMIGAAIEGPQQGWSSEASYLVGLHWDAPAEVFLGSLHVNVEVLNSDTGRYLARTEVAGALDPAAAPPLPLAGMSENGPNWRGGEFRGPLASGETRWYRLDLERGEEMNAFALFPGDRYVGERTAGDFSMVLTDGDGNPIGAAFDGPPRLSQTFGDDNHQATVSGTTAWDPDPLSQTVLIGFRWDGSPGQESEVRFAAEAILNPGREEVADRIAAEEGGDDEAGNEESPAAVIAEREGPEAAGPGGHVDSGSGEGGGPPLGVIIALGVILVGGVAAVVTRRVTQT
jgi:hypothetical protein